MLSLGHAEIQDIMSQTFHLILPYLRKLTRGTSQAAASYRAEKIRTNSLDEFIGPVFFCFFQCPLETPQKNSEKSCFERSSLYTQFSHHDLYSSGGSAVARSPPMAAVPSSIPGFCG